MATFRAPAGGIHAQVEHSMDLITDRIDKGTAADWRVAADDVAMLVTKVWPWLVEREPDAEKRKAFELQAPKSNPGSQAFTYEVALEVHRVLRELLPLMRKDKLWGREWEAIASSAELMAGVNP